MSAEFDDIPLYELLPKLIERFQPTSYLEIGVNEGKSVLLVVIHGQPKLCEITLCDTWGDRYGGSGRGTHRHIEKLLEGVFRGKVNWMDGDSKVTCRTIACGTIDFALVDGDHSAEGCRTDMENVFQALNRNGLMVVDDLTHHAHPWLQMVFDEFCGSHACHVLRRAGIGVIQKT